jgi:hypothetical protein
MIPAIDNCAPWVLTPVEEAILSDYFGLPRPEALASLDPTVPDPEWPWGVHLEPSDPSCPAQVEKALARAAGRILLLPSEFRVPATELRPARFATRLRGGALIRVRWYPGAGWSESYQTLRIQNFQRFVVIAFSPESENHSPRAIGHHALDGDPKKEWERILSAHWATRHPLLRDPPTVEAVDWIASCLTFDPWKVIASVWPGAPGRPSPEVSPLVWPEARPSRAPVADDEGGEAPAWGVWEEDESDEEEGEENWR